MLCRMKKKSSAPRDPPRVLGWREWVGLPDLGVGAIKAKLDTGARSSALHTFDVETFRKRGRSMVRFAVHPIQRSNLNSLVCEAEVVDEREVRSSSGTLQKRLVIATTVSLMETEHSIELTLARRDQMGFRLLLGRQALAHRFLVDSGRSFLDSPGGKQQRRSLKKPRLQKKRRSP